MVLDLLALALPTATSFPLANAIGVPVAVSVSEGIRHSREQDGRNTTEVRGETAPRDLDAARFGIEIYCESKSRKRDQVHGAVVVLKNNKLYLTGKDPRTGNPLPLRGSAGTPHPFTGFYVHYPVDSGPSIQGLVSTIPPENWTSSSKPLLNWIYVDKTTLEVKYGSRLASRGNIVGPWDWTEDEEGVTLEGWEGLVAVEEEKDAWALYYDREDDGLEGLVKGKRVLQCSLERKLLDKEDEEEKEEE